MITVNIKKGAKYGVLFQTPKHIRYILSYGGRATGRSFQNSRADIINLFTKDYYRAFLMRNVLDSVRDSIYQDCVDRIHELGLQTNIVESKLIIKEGDNQLKGRGFRKSSGSDTAKNKSLAGYNKITIEEAEEIDKDDFYQLDLSLRTVKSQVTVCMMFNPPVKGHWLLNDWFDLIPATKENAVKHFGKCWFEEVEEHCLKDFFLMIPKKSRDGVDTHYIFGTYKDNIKNLDQNTIRLMERFKETDIDYYLHKICGLVPSQKTGRVFNNFDICTDAEFDELPYPSLYGLDFGFNDPTALVEVKRHDDKLWVREVLYDSNLNIDQVYDRIKHVKDKIIADSQAKQSIDTLKAKGLYIIPSIKGKDSIVLGIQKIKNHKVFICENSKNLQKEFENYVWKLDSNKNPTDAPEDEFNHGIDAIRYSLNESGGALANYYKLLNKNAK